MRLPDPFDAELVDSGLTHDGILLRRDALAMGIDDKALARLVRCGELTRVRHGAYVDRRLWDGSDDRGRHAFLSGAVMRQYGEHVALSHGSAAVAYGAPTWGLDLDSVHLTHLDGAGRRSAGVVHHEGSVRVGDVRRDGARWVTTPTRTALDTISTSSVEVGVVVGSWFLNQGLTSVKELALAQSVRSSWPGTLTDRLALGLVGEKFESVGESRSAYMFWRHGLPAPESQWKVYRPNGRLAGRVDFAWPEFGLLCEFDGLEKYRRPWAVGVDAAEVVVREKNREDLLRELTGWRFIRLIWADLERPDLTVARIRRLMHRVA